MENLATKNINPDKLKTVGLLGGLGYESTITYYEEINKLVNKAIGNSRYPKILLYSFDFGKMYNYQLEDRWEDEARELIKAANYLEKGGADFVLMCSNTPHKIADLIESNISVPLLHIVDAVAGDIKKSAYKKVGLIGTPFTMRETFYKDRLSKFDIETIVPDEYGIGQIEDLMSGNYSVEDNKEKINTILKEIINKLAKNGAEAVILGCTEFGLLVSEEDCDVPLFDSALIHARVAAEMVLGKVSI